MKQSIVLMLGLALAGTAAARDTTPAPALGEADREVLTSIVIDTWASHVDDQHRQRWQADIEQRAGEVPLAWVERAATALDLRSAELALQGLASLDEATPSAFGEVGGDLVFTPLPPCRLLDTRQPSERTGPIPSNSERSFYGFSVNFQIGQGGANNDCGLRFDTQPEALAITLVAVNPVAEGFLTAYPFGGERPLAASLNYIAGTVASTGLIVPINNELTVDEFAIYTWRETHVVADVTGYFSRPQAAALDCMSIQGTHLVLPAGGVNIARSATCPAGYAPMLGSCTTSTQNAVLVWHALEDDSQRTACLYRNNGATVETLKADAHCCRVPGR